MPSNGDSFNIWLTKGSLNNNFLLGYMTDGLSRLRKSTPGTLYISEQAIIVKDEQGIVIQECKPSQVQSITDRLSAITIVTDTGGFSVNFYNVLKGGLKLMLFRFYQGKDSPLSPVVQANCKQAIEELINCGYSATLSSKEALNVAGPASHLLDLGQRANQLFNSANPLQQQQILKGLVYNVEMFDQKLSYSLINCYEAFKQLNEKAQSELNDTSWCPELDSNQRP